MTRPRRIPARGDIAASLVAELLGLSLTDFEARQSALRERGFPEPDPTTGLYCIEALDRWRMGRHARLFPELTTAPTATHADAVFGERLRRFDGDARRPAKANRVRPAVEKDDEASMQDKGIGAARCAGRSSVTAGEAAA
jgi:hypothetical protein